MEARIEAKELRSRICSATEAADCIQDGMTVAFGGYTSSGYPKMIAAELAARRAAGEELRIELMAGSAVGPIENVLGDVIGRQMPMIESKSMQQLANKGEAHYVEQQMNKMLRLLRSGALGDIDVAVVEALGITKEGYIIPTSSVGMVPHLLERAKAVIVEINTAQPESLRGFHDIYIPGLPPRQEPIPLTYVNEHIGDSFIKLDPDKIQHIVASDRPDEATRAADGTTITQQLADHLINFLELEAQKRGWNGWLPPVQTGFGNLAANIVKALQVSNFREISFFCGGLQEANMELAVAGRVKAASTGSIQMTPRVMEILKTHGNELRKIITLRNADITNNSETIGRMGIIALNSAIEADIFGNVNSSHITGNRVVNGLGGGANFAHNAGLSILLIPSENKAGAISTIVPMVSHCDISEHDIDVLITDQGVADLRGLDDVERAQAIIQNCAGLHYRERLAGYLKKAQETVGGHHPMLLSEALSWHIRLKETGTMLDS